MFEVLGKKLFTSLGDKRVTDSICKSYFNDAWSELASFYKVSDLLPYDAYSSKHQLFYNQTGASEEMQKEAKLKSVKTKQGSYAEVMISGEKGYAVGRLLLDPFSNLLYSTKAQDYAAVKQLTSRGLKQKDAIEYILEAQAA